MTTIKANDNSDRASATETSQWFNLRRKRCWAAIVLLLYTLLGFFAVSAIIKTKLIDLIEEDLGRSAHIQAVLFNPYELSLRIRQFEMQDIDGVKLAAFDDFFVNFQLSSLFRWALTFREIRLDNSYVYYERFDAVDSRISRMLADVAKNKPPQADQENVAGLPRFLIHKLALNGGAVKIKDNVPATPVVMNLGPININIKELNTLPDQYGKQTVAIDLPDDARLQWQGNLSLTPLDSQGEMRLTNANLDVSTAYLTTILPLEAVQARLSSGFEYHVQLNNDGQIDVDIDNLDVELDDVAITGLSPSTEFFALKQLALRGGKLRYPEQSVVFSSLKFTEPKVAVWRNKDGGLSVSDLVPASKNEESAQPETETETETETEEKRVEPEVAPNNSPASQPWQVALKELVLEQGQFDFADNSIAPAAQIGIKDLTVKASDISNQPDAKIPLTMAANLTQGGELTLSGIVEILPEFSFSAQTKTRGIPLSIAQPYVQQYTRIQVNKGKLSSDLSIAIPAGKPLTISGALQIPGLEINDTVESKRLLAWKNLTVERLNLDLAANKLALSPLQFEQLFGRVIIYKDKTTNLSGLVIEQDKKTAKEEVSKGDKFDVVIGGVSVKQGGMDFSDLSLPLPFATRIKDLNGTISTIATNSSQPANIKLEGQVDDYGLSRINGAINLLDPLHRTGISVQFRNLLMSKLSPYTIQFAGREIAEGKLDLDLNYDITKSQLQASNKVVISDLQLGAKVDHPEAASLPLGLAVALLKDPSGKIDINLPIEGDVDDPEFRIGGIIWQTFAGLIVKAVTSPFSLLAGLIGVDSDDLGEFQFLAGRSDLTPPELEKVAQLKQALLQRPKLSVEINGAFDPEIDVPALKYSRLRSTLIMKKGDESEELKDIDILDERLFKPLKSLFVERFPDIPLKTVRNENKLPPADDPEGRPVLDKLAYAADLRDRLLETVVITEEELIALAQARAEAIRTAFLMDEFDVSRVVMVEPEAVKSKDGQWVKFELGVTAK
jgi:Domain of Unknown Function (DUF748)